MLRKLYERKHAEVAERRAAVDDTILERSALTAAPPRSLATALEGAGINLICEVKRRSPSAGDLGVDVDPAEQARAYVHGGAAAISVLTDEPLFGGSLGDLRAVRATIDVPILRKDFIVDRYQLLEARADGADAVLLIAGMLDLDELRTLHAAATELGLDVLVEAHSEQELELALQSGAYLVGINNRDLTTFTTDLQTTVSLAPRLAELDVLLVAESGIESPADIELLANAGARAFLVGSSLMRSGNPEQSVRNLRAVGSELQVKLCGLRSIDDARAAIAAGADYLGFVFAPSKRQVDSSLVRSIVTQLRADTPTRRMPLVVGVFVDAPADEVNAAAAQAGLDLVQLSGSEPAGFEQQLDLPAIRVVHVGPDGIDLAGTHTQPGGLLLLDTRSNITAGGTGETFDWSRVVNRNGQRLLVAGGLTPDNVAEAVRALRPAGVDVSSGIERDGIKDPELMRAFVSAARGAVQ